MKRILLFALWAGMSLYTSAQSTLKGKVFDALTQNNLAGATISVAGKSVATSDKEGRFSFQCNGSVTMTISFVGYATQKRTVNCSEDIRIGLELIGNTLDNVEITATSGRNKSMLHQPVSITKLSTLELKRGTGLFLDDAVNGNVPGVTMNRRSVSGGQQFNIRGYGNGSRGTRGISSNFDGQGYKVYLNGIPVTDAEGITTLDDIDYSSVGNVEVVKGPAGTLYGLAIAGTVNLTTLKPEKGKTTVGQDIMLGNYGLQRYTTHLQMGADRASLLLNYGKQKSDGFANHNASHKDFVNIAGDFQPNEKQSVTSYVGFSDSYDERLGELTLAQWANNDYSGNIDYIKRNAHSHVTSFRGGLGHTYLFNKSISNTTSVFGTGFNSDASSAGGWTDKTAINYGLRTTFDTKFESKNGILISGITGLETQKQIAQTIGYNLKQNPADPSSTPWVIGKPYWVINATTSNNATVAGTTSLFPEWTMAFLQDLSVTAGIGISNMKIALDDRFNAETATKPSHYDTVYKSMVSPHLAVNKVFNKHISAYASYSSGFKAPVSSYFFIVTPAVSSPATPATGRVNAVLKPERADQFEIGSKGNLLHNRLNYQLALFHTRFRNKMTTVAVQLNSTTTAYTYMVNGGDQDHKGVEALVKYVAYQSATGFFSAVTPFFNMAYSDFNYGDNYKYQSGSTTANITTVDYSGKRVAGVAKIVVNWGFDVTTRPGLYLNFIHNYKDGMPITSDGINKTSSFNLLNGKIGFRRSFTSRLDMDLFLGVNNITGTKYPLMVFVNQLPDAYIPAPPDAVVFGGINLKYNLHK